MVLADVMAVVFSVIGMLLALPALWLLCRGLWPAQVEAAEVDCERTLWKPFVTGLLPGFLVFIAVGALSKLGPIAGIVAIALVSGFVVFASVGIAGLSTLVGKRLPSKHDADHPWKATLRGAIIVEVSCLIPFVGWFILLPVTFILGAGATCRLMWRGMKKQSAAPAAATIADARVEPSIN